MPIHSNYWVACIKNHSSVNPPRKKRRRRCAISAPESRRSGNGACRPWEPCRRTSNGSELGDRGSDIYTFWQACEQWGYDFVIRLAQDRRALLEEEAEDDDPAIYHLKTLARSLPAQDGRVLQVPGVSTNVQHARHLSRSVGMAACHHGSRAQPRRGLGARQMVQVAVALGGLPQSS